jgi:MOSC domain-containing protein
VLRGATLVKRSFGPKGVAVASNSAQSSSVTTEAGTVVGLWRYPVKSMMGEELNAAEITERGLLGDRQFALVDAATGKVAGAKNPRKWGNFFDFRAAYVEPPEANATLPAVRLTLPNGTALTTENENVDEVLSSALGRAVELTQVRAEQESSAEEYVPDIDGLDHRDTVTEWELPAGTFFDLAVVHLLTTATLDHLSELYPAGRFEARRFRPNIVISTAERGFVENDWLGRTVTIGDTVRLRITRPCPRCVMTTLAQGDLPKDPGILRTAAQNSAAKVGVYADVLSAGAIHRGDPVVLS